MQQSAALCRYDFACNTSNEQARTESWHKSAAPCGGEREGAERFAHVRDRRIPEEAAIKANCTLPASVHAALDAF